MKEKQFLLFVLKLLRATYGKEAETYLAGLKYAAISNRNVFGQLIEATKVCSLGQITDALFEVGGEPPEHMSRLLAPLAAA